MYNLYFNEDNITELYNLLCTEINFGTPYALLPDRIEVLGRSGGIDITDLFGVNYSDREFSASFSRNSRYSDYEHFKSEFIKNYEGQKIQVSDQYNSNRYILGRVNIEIEQSELGVAEIEIEGAFDPWWYDKSETVVEINNTEETEYILTNKKMPVIPTIYTEDTGMEIIFKGKRYSVLNGMPNYKIHEIYLEEGNNAITIVGVGTIIFTYRQGEL